MKLIFSLLVLSSLVWSCQPKEAEFEGLIIREQAFAEQIISDVRKLIQEDFERDSTINKTEAEYVGCNPEITFVHETGQKFPCTVTYDFGEKGQECIDGKNRSGKIIAEFTGKFTQEGTRVTIQFDNYIVEGYTVSGTKRIENTGRNSDDQLQFGITVEDLLLNNIQLEETIQWNSKRTFTWFRGSNTLQVIDDEWEVSGTASGVTSSGLEYESIIRKPIKLEFCKWITSGDVVLLPSIGDSLTIQYGSGRCDNTCDIQFRGKSYSIRMI